MDKMREEFEEWVIGRNVCVKYGAKLRKNADGSYSDYRINDRWMAWKASRAALCVELPEKMNPDAVLSLYDIGFNNGIDGAMDCIEQTGVSCK